MPVPIDFVTVVIKKQALEECFPGGLKGFLQSRPNLPADEQLVGIPFMSGGEVEDFLNELQAVGINLQTSCAVGDMMLGAMLTCPGIEFCALAPNEPFSKQWQAAVTTQTQALSVLSEPED